VVETRESRDKGWVDWILCLGGDIEVTRVVFAEKEFSRLMGTARQHLMAKSKESVLYAAVNLDAQGLWRTGSLEHVAMKHLGPDLVIRVAMGAYETRGGVPKEWVRAGLCSVVPILLSLRYIWTRARSFRGKAWIMFQTALVMGGLGTIVRMRLKSMARTVYYRRSGSEEPIADSSPAGEEAATVAAVPEGGTPAAPPPSPEAPPHEPPLPPGLDPPEGRVEPENAILASDDLPEEHGPPERARAARRPNENEDIVMKEENGRYVRTEVGEQEVWCILGQNFSSSAATDHAQRVGVLTGPNAKPPLVYANTADNVEAAIDRRLTMKAKKCTWTDADKKKVGRMVSDAIGHKGIFQRARVDAWFRRHFNVNEWKSKKWSDERMQTAIECLLREIDPEFRLKTSIKAEDMPEGKPPRFLIADGDAGQVMALASIKCFEELLFETNEEHSVKHASKSVAMQRILGAMKVPAKRKARGYTFVEGDGSAWDTTCNHTVRCAIENPVVEHIGAVLCELGLVPEQWVRAHEKVNKGRTYKVYFKRLGQVFKDEIPAIRRSGHRGTSVLNYWVNYVMWVCAVFDSPSRFLDPKARVGTDVSGEERWFFGAWEGDDSGVQTSPKLVMVTDEDRGALRNGTKTYDDLTDAGRLVTTKVVETSAKALDFWDRAGFNMVFIFAKQRATIVGMHVHLDSDDQGNTAPSGLYCPELPRGIGKNLSCSPAALHMVRDGCLKGFRRIAAAANLARAADYAGILPTVSRKYKEYADRLDAGDYDDREMSMHISGEEGLSATGIRDEIDLRNSKVSPDDEKETMDKLCYCASEDELAQFNGYLWDLDTVTDHDGYSRSLPASWKAGGSV
jgi:hypothetical protein